MYVAMTRACHGHIHEIADEKNTTMVKETTCKHHPF